MDNIAVLEAVGRKLNAEAGAPDLPSLFFFTDPARTPDPLAIARRMPAGSAVAYRHFGAADRREMARALADICKERGVWLLIGGDHDLARDSDAGGVHWPARMVVELPKGVRDRFMLETAAAHGADSLAAAGKAGLEAAVLGPVFETRSSARRPALGLTEASRLARSAALPVIALGGIHAGNAHELLGRGFAGLAAVDAFLEA